MNPISELFKKGWYRLINRYYYPPNPIPYNREVHSYIYYQLYSAYYEIHKHEWRQYYPQNDAVCKGIIQYMLKYNRLPKELGYRHFTKPKKDGTERHLAEPNPFLKAIQYEILKNRLVGVPTHPSAIGFRKGKSIADHVWAHAGADLIITADIQDFFPNTHTDRVKAWYSTVFEDENVVRLMTLLTTYQGGLPQGAPTSPMLSNLVNYEMDRQIAKRTELGGGKYTRYGDDMVFSWYHRPPSDFERAIRAILRTEGYELHPQKGWRVYHKRDEPEVTGVILTKNGGVSVPDWVHQRIRELKRSPEDSHQLAGYLAYQKMVETRK